MHYEIPSRRDLLPMDPDDLPHPSPDAIAHHRAADRFFDAEAEAALRQLVGAKKYSEVGIRAALACAIHGIKLSPPH